MSQFPSAPPPGAYVPPTEGNQQSGFNPQQQQYFQPSQASSPYQGSAPNYVPSHQSHKGSQGLGQMFNQAVTTGKPMLNKLGKTISSKLGSKQSASSTPQHLESYHNYHQQQHQSQSHQPPAQQSSPLSQQQQWQPPPQHQNTFATPQQSPFPQSHYATPASGHSGQSNYFPQQSPQTPNSQTPLQQPNAPTYNPNQFTVGQAAGAQQQGQPAHGQVQQGQFNQGQQQGQFQQAPQPQHGSFSEQQTGVIGASTSTPGVANQPNQQQQWAAPPPSPGNANPASPSSPVPQQTQPSSQPYGAAPVHPNQQQQLQQQQTIHAGHSNQQQQWAPLSPSSPQGQPPNQIPHTASPPPPQTPSNQAQVPLNIPPQPSPQPQPPTPISQHAPKAEPTEFLAELPADLGNLNLGEGSKPRRSLSNSPTQPAPYQAYQPPAAAQNQGQGFTIARRAVSMSSLPLADPWRIADPSTEVPTREFYIIADLLFDALDRKFEPRNTGMLEASKILESWKVQELAEEVAELFAYDTYSAFARLWCLEGVPHVMVPRQANLTPCWNFQPQAQSQEMKIVLERAPGDLRYPEYVPALNRAGWYKYLFMEWICEPEALEKWMPGLCADTYKPGVLNQPDFQKRDKSVLPELTARAKAMRNGAIPRVCRETAVAMQAG